MCDDDVGGRTKCNNNEELWTGFGNYIGCFYGYYGDIIDLEPIIDPHNSGNGAFKKKIHEPEGYND